MKIRSILASIFFGALIGAGLTQIGIARADTNVCSYLDARPTIAGVEDLVGIGININGWSPQYTGQFIVDQIMNYCPRHLTELNAWIAKWNAAPAPAPTQKGWAV